MADRLTNWAGNVEYAPQRLHYPETVAELQQTVARSAKVRTLGSGHSFNTIANCADDMVSMARMPAICDVDSERATVTVSAGTRYGELAGFLHSRGLALANLGSLPHISIAGACATGTHGSGAGNGNLATAVSAIAMVSASGDLIHLDRTRDRETFDGAVVSLGALGVVTTLTLDVVPTFDVSQRVYDALPAERLRDSFDDILTSGYSVSVFTAWDEPRHNWLWSKQIAGDREAPADLWGALPADGPRHPIPGIDPANCTQQLGVPGPWHERLPHFRLAFTPSSGAELQSEYLLPRRHAAAAIGALDEISAMIAPVLYISEIRLVAADRLWLSPAQGRDTVAFHFTWIQDVAAVAPVVAAIEQALAPYDARPHWGKVFSTAPDRMPALYERYDDFLRLMAAYDPDGCFRNEWIDRYFSGP